MLILFTKDYLMITTQVISIKESKFEPMQIEQVEALLLAMRCD